MSDPKKKTDLVITPNASPELITAASNIAIGVASTVIGGAILAKMTPQPRQKETVTHEQIDIETKTATIRISRTKRERQ